MIYFELFVTFFKIGLFSFGGGYAILAVIQQEVTVVHEWLTQGTFMDVVALSQVTPGPVSINTATFVGWQVGGLLGSITATGALVLPSVIIMLILSHIMTRFSENRYVKTVIRGIFVVAIGLILSAALSMLTGLSLSVFNIVLLLGSFVLVYRFKVGPIAVMLLAGATGIIWHMVLLPFIS